MGRRRLKPFQLANGQFMGFALLADGGLGSRMLKPLQLTSGQFLGLSSPRWC